MPPRGGGGGRVIRVRHGLLWQPVSFTDSLPVPCMGGKTHALRRVLSAYGPYNAYRLRHREQHEDKTLWHYQ
jgi:hypothetical protein